MEKLCCCTVSREVRSWALLRKQQSFSWNKKTTYNTIKMTYRMAFLPLLGLILSSRWDIEHDMCEKKHLKGDFDFIGNV